MTRPFRTLTRGSSLSLLAFSVFVAGLMLYGMWTFLNSHYPISRPAAVGITHSTPVGGAVEDGVYRSAPEDEDSDRLTVSRI